MDINVKLSMFFYLLIGILKHSVSECNFPADWNETWYDSRTGEITMNVSSAGIRGWDIEPFGLLSSKVTSWTCLMDNTSHIAFRSDKLIAAYTGPYVAYICLQLYNVTRYSSYYYVLGDIEPNADFQRIKLINSVEVQPSTLDEACAFTSGPPIEEFHMLVKKGYEMEVKQYCPLPLLGIFNYSCTDILTDQLMNYTELDVCTDRRIMTFNYSLCNNTQAHSFEGEVYCVTYLQDNNTYYLSVLNPGIVDNVQFYRFTCYAIEANGTDVIVSQSPRDCEIGQTPFKEPTDGALQTLYPYAICPFSESTLRINIYTDRNESTTETNIAQVYSAGYTCLWLIILLILGLLFLHCCLICIIAGCGRRRKKKNQIHTVKERDDKEQNGVTFPKPTTSRKLAPLEDGPILRLPNGVNKGFKNPLPPISSR